MWVINCRQESSIEEYWRFSHEFCWFTQTMSLKRAWSHSNKLKKPDRLEQQFRRLKSCYLKLTSLSISFLWSTTCSPEYSNSSNAAAFCAKICNGQMSDSDDCKRNYIINLLFITLEFGNIYMTFIGLRVEQDWTDSSEITPFLVISFCSVLHIIILFRRFLPKFYFHLGCYNYMIGAHRFRWETRKRNLRAWFFSSRQHQAFL